MVIGLGIDENFVASDVAALLPVTRRFMFLDEGDVAEIRRKSIEILDAAGGAPTRPIRESDLPADAVERGQYRHFMLKEIHEQPRAIAQTLGGASRRRQTAGRGFRPRRPEVFKRGQGGPYRRLRHELPRGPRRELFHRADLPHSGTHRNRQRIPLSRSRDHARHAVRNHFAIRRNRRYPGGAAQCKAGGVSVDAHDLQCRRKLDGPGIGSRAADARRS